MLFYKTPDHFHTYIPEKSKVPEYFYQVDYMQHYLSTFEEQQIYYQELLTNAFRIVLIQWKNLTAIPTQLHTTENSVLLQLTFSAPIDHVFTVTDPISIKIMNSNCFHEQSVSCEQYRAIAWVEVMSQSLPDSSYINLLANKFPVIKKPANQKIYQHILGILAHPGRVPFIYLKIQSCLLMLMNYYAVSGEIATWSSAESITMTETQKEKVIAYIKAELDNPYLTINDIARHMYMSSRSFQKMFTHNFGIPAKQYVRINRLERALKLLKETFFTMEQICVETGFSDTSYFTKVFKKYYGMLPKEARAVTRHIMPS